MVEGVIYRYVSPSGKSYIGQTTNEKIRREHWNTVGPYAGIKINRARIKYGLESFKYEVLEKRIFSSKKQAKEELDKLEVYYIGLYNSYVHGYNCTIGGDSTVGYKFSTESKNRISIANRGKKRTDEVKKKLSLVRRGVKLTEEWRNNISKSLKGRPCTWSDKIIKAKTIKGVLQFSLEEELIQSFPSVKEASLCTGIAEASLYKCLNGKHKTSGGFIWKYSS